MIECFKNKLNVAVQQLYDNDIILVERGGMEQACVSRIYYYLQKMIDVDNILNFLNLDCEYNKNGEEAKWCVDIDTGERFQTRPDMLFHRRGNNYDNKVIVEFKGWWNNNHDSDIRKLKAFTQQEGDYRYELGILVKLNKNGPQYIYYRDARPSEI